MEKPHNDTLLKPRSYRNVLTTGLRFYHSNLRKLLKASWLWALAYAAVCGLLGVMAGPNVETLLLLLVIIVSSVMASGAIIAKLAEHRLTDAVSMPSGWLPTAPAMMGRVLKSWVFSLPLAVLSVGILALPLCYVQMKYLMEDGSYWSTLRRHLGEGFRHFGSLLLVNFASLLLIVIVSTIVALPATILSMAHLAAWQGMLIGDAISWPSYITGLSFATYMVCSFLYFYVSQLLIIHNYFMYGSIEANRQEA